MKPGEPTSADLHVGSELVVRAIAGVPTIDAGQDLSEVIISGLARTETELVDGDVMVLASKIVSRAEGCFVDLGGVTPSDTALHLAEEVDKDPRLVELILRESTGVSRKTTGALIVRHRLGFVSANAGIDASNAAPSSAPEGSGPWVLILPRDPDATAARLRAQLARHFSAEVGVIITDSWGRPFRRGTVGFALGVAGVPA
ncbi:MAG: coenzyme F420-0:L-glutamate ligase, partial [Deltaproteobacteria bacterium]|nr:coenzyme F420-0:L-glutamate ligase [Deltaproteobacteria bacterium]